MIYIRAEGAPEKYGLNLYPWSARIYRIGGVLVIKGVAKISFAYRSKKNPGIKSRPDGGAGARRWLFRYEKIGKDYGTYISDAPDQKCYIDLGDYTPDFHKWHAEQDTRWK